MEVRGAVPRLAWSFRALRGQAVDRSHLVCFHQLLDLTPRHTLLQLLGATVVPNGRGGGAESEWGGGCGQDVGGSSRWW